LGICQPKQTVIQKSIYWDSIGKQTTNSKFFVVQCEVCNRFTSKGKRGGCICTLDAPSRTNIQWKPTSMLMASGLFK